MANTVKETPTLIVSVAGAKYPLEHGAKWQPASKSLTISSKETRLFEALEEGAELMVTTRTRKEGGFDTSPTEGVVESITIEGTEIVVVIGDKPEPAPESESNTAK